VTLADHRATALRSINPHAPADVVFEFDPADPRAVDAAVSRARAASAAWAGLSAMQRGAALQRIARDIEEHSDALVSLQVRECGKPLGEATAEVRRAVAIFDYYGHAILAPDGETYPSRDGSWLTARRYPVGVVGIVMPWNLPAAIHAWKCAPALGYGNTVVLKTAPQSAAVGELIGTITARHLPDGVFELVHGGAGTGRSLVEHPGVDAISFTGSVDAGRAVAVAAVSRGANAQCETGGQNPSVVLRDADLERAAGTIAYAAMAAAGQKCTATRRVIVEAPVYDELRERLTAAIDALPVLDPADARCVVGPLIDGDAMACAREAIAASGGRVLTGGTLLDADGYYLAPTLVELDEPSGVLAHQEVFAPVAALIRAADADQAISIANDVRYGLAAALFTTDLCHAVALLGRLEAGLVRTNAATTGSDFHAPFGGLKASSIGPREQGLAAREFYTELRTQLVAP